MAVTCPEKELIQERKYPTQKAPGTQMDPAEGTQVNAKLLHIILQPKRYGSKRGMDEAASRLS